MPENPSPEMQSFMAELRNLTTAIREIKPGTPENIKDFTQTTTASAVMSNESTKTLEAWAKQLRDNGVSLGNFKGAMDKLTLDIGGNKFKVGTEAFNNSLREFGKELATGKADLGLFFKELRNGASVIPMFAGMAGTMIKGFAGVLGTASNLFRPIIAGVQAGVRSGEVGAGDLTLGSMYAGKYAAEVRMNMAKLNMYGYSTEEAQGMVTSFAGKGLQSGAAAQAGMVSRLTGISTETLGNSFQILSRRFQVGDEDLGKRFLSLAVSTGKNRLSVDELSSVFASLSEVTYGTSTDMGSFRNTIAQFSGGIKARDLTQGQFIGAMGAAQSMPFQNVAGVLALARSRGIGGISANPIEAMNQFFRGQTGEGIAGTVSQRAQILQKLMGSFGGSTGQQEGIGRMLAGTFGFGSIERIAEFSKYLGQFAQTGKLTAEQQEKVDVAKSLEPNEKVAIATGLMVSPLNVIQGAVLGIWKHLIDKTVDPLGNRMETVGEYYASEALDVQHKMDVINKASSPVTRELGRKAYMETAAQNVKDAQSMFLSQEKYNAYAQKIQNTQKVEVEVRLNAEAKKLLELDKAAEKSSVDIAAAESRGQLTPGPLPK